MCTVIQDNICITPIATQLQFFCGEFMNQYEFQNHKFMTFAIEGGGYYGDLLAQTENTYMSLVPVPPLFLAQRCAPYCHPSKLMYLQEMDRILFFIPL